MSSKFDPWEDRKDACLALLEARNRGKTLKQAAAAAGIHIATACRWAALCPDLAQWLKNAERVGRRGRLASRPKTRPRVPHHPRCPKCGAAVQVRSAAYIRLRFWRCSRWPVCEWASWRPRHPEDCPTCCGPRFWSHSRKSVFCPRCAVRIIRQ